MRHSYLVTYDVCDPKRLRRVYKTLLGFGDHIQLSVFRCELNHRELVELRSALSAIIHTGEDQVLLASLGPVEGRARDAIRALGKPFLDPERLAVVVG
jgi:CRISPR-associated protein Cas2